MRRRKHLIVDKHGYHPTIPARGGPPIKPPKNPRLVSGYKEPHPDHPLHSGEPYRTGPAKWELLVAGAIVLAAIAVVALAGVFI